MISSRRDFLKATGTAIAALAAGPILNSYGEPADTKASAIKTKPKHILLLMCDQYRFNALGCMGDKNAITPNLDALAEEGTLFTRAYCQNPVCVPSRTSLLMGRYSHSTGVYNNAHRAYTTNKSFPQMLRQAGYTTACFGKLHIKGRNELDWDVYESMSIRPQEVQTGKTEMGSRFGTQKPLGQPAPFPDKYHREWPTKEATKEFIEKNSDKPWFIQCSFYKPHPPFQPPQKYWDMIDREKLVIPEYPKDDLNDTNPDFWARMISHKVDNITRDEILDAMQGYYGNIACCDEWFGEVLDTLDKQGIRDDTLILFTADHGEMFYDHTLWTKYTFFEQSVHVPFIASWKGVLPEKRRCDALIEHVDLYPTLMDLAGIDTPASVEGTSFINTLQGKTDTHREFVRSEFGSDLEMLMQFDGRFKYIDNGDDTPPELYDLKTDPREITNIASDPQYKPQLGKHIAELRNWRDKTLVPPQRKKKA